MTFQEFDVLSHSPYFKPYFEPKPKQPEVKLNPLTPDSPRYRQMPGKKKSKKSRRNSDV